MKTSAEGRALIEQREGRRLVAYRDTMGILTIGVGHTGRMSGPPVTPGMTITDALCDAMLVTDLEPVERVINAAVKVPISQNEFDAMASLGFNIGAEGLKGSTVLKRLNLGDVAGAAEAFMMWDHPAGLESRRVAEKKQFLTPNAAVSSNRSVILRANAAATQAKARRLRNVGGALVPVGTATAVVVAQSSHHTLAWIIAAVVVLGAGVALVATLANRSKSAVLAVNAGKQAAVAVVLTPSTNNLKA